MNRIYNIHDYEYPSVTTVLDIIEKPALKQWAVNMCVKYIEDNNFKMPLSELLNFAKTEWKNVSKEACDIGSRVHFLIEQKTIKKNDTDISKELPEVQNAYNAFCEWEDANIGAWLEKEKTVHDPDYCYAGTLDAVAEMIDGNIWLIDFKTSKGFYDGYDMQISAYLKAYNKMPCKYKATHAGILRLDKETGLPDFKDYTKKIESSYEAFLKLLDFFYSWKKRRIKNSRGSGCGVNTSEIQTFT